MQVENESDKKDFSNKPNWRKLMAYERLRHDYEWIWFLDADAFIMTKRSIHSVIEDALNNYSELKRGNEDIIMAKDRNGFNTGSFLVRTSKWTDNLFEKWLETRFDMQAHKRKPWTDNLLFNKATTKDLWKELRIADHLIEVPLHMINSYAFKGAGGDFYRKGDLVLHSPGFGFKHSVEFIAKHNLTEV